MVGITDDLHWVTVLAEGGWIRPRRLTVPLLRNVDLRRGLGFGYGQRR
jgi:hypothetical protein